MNGKCLDIGEIQAFLDGEATAERSNGIRSHVAECTACAEMLAVAEDENSFVFSTLDREMNTLVPTQRLWSRINESIDVEKTKEPIWKQVYAFISTAFSSPSVTVAASALLVIGVVAVVLTMRSGESPADAPTIATVMNPAPQGVTPQQSEFVQTPIVDDAVSSEPSANAPIQVKAGDLSNEKLEKLVRETNGRDRIRPITLDLNSPLPSEKGYIRTIADLKQNVDGRKDAVFSPSSRVTFERDLAVVNDSISRMQKVVRKNPNNQAARQALYSSYQDKIDLLNSVAQRDELIASIK